MQKLSQRILFLLLAGSLAVALRAAEWRYEVVDPSGGGKFSSMQIDSYGNIHASYFDDTQHLLKYSFWDRKLAKWFTTLLDNKSAGFCSLALDSNQRPHVSYLEYGTGHLKYAHWNGVSWQTEAIRLRAFSVEFYTSITVDSDDHPVISYYEVFGTAYPDYSLLLRNVKWNGQLWQASTIDWTPGSGKFNSIAKGSDGHLHIAYANVRSETASLRYASWDGKSWQIEMLEGARSPSPIYSVSMVLEKGDVPHIAYTDVAKHLVKYATRQDGKWQVQIVGSLAREGYPDRNGIALDAAGNPHISYFDAGRGALVVAHREDKRWVSEVVDSDFTGFNSSIRIANGEIIVIYYDTVNRALKCARRPLDVGDPLSQEGSVSLKLNK